MVRDDSICVLLAIWGERYIKDFLGLGLPCLLAPGNIPALATYYPVRFIFLTRADNVSIFDDHPAIQKLKAYCKIEYIAIDDLITVGNYSTTLTLAFDRAIRAAGKKMLKTYFLILTADYIMADGSLRGLMRYIQAGYNGICAGNFQVIKEDTRAFFLNKIDPISQVIQIQPRELLEYSFEHLHPITIASIFNQNILHNYQANRFFYRYSLEVLAASFYLLHPLCIKPETENYRVGAACDYSFIPEMCPSGNIAILTDSDEYLVVEMQPRQQEVRFVNGGKYKDKKLIETLGEWTTKQHRKNAQTTIYFHTCDVYEEEKARIRVKLNVFTERINKLLERYPEQPHYDHPYWMGAIEAFQTQKKIISKNYYDYFDITSFSEKLFFPKRLYYYCFGIPPKVFRWHHRWREYQLVKQTLKERILSEDIKNTMVLYDDYYIEFMIYYRFFKDIMHIHNHYHLENFINSKTKLKELENNKVNICVIVISSQCVEKIKVYLPIINLLLNPNGKIFIIIPNKDNHVPSFVYDFPLECIQKLGFLWNIKNKYLEFVAIRNNLTYLSASIYSKIDRWLGKKNKLKVWLLILLGLPGAVLYFIINHLSGKANKEEGHCTTVIVTFVPDRVLK
ncbi:MAG: hypothetical protein EPO11_04055 [Gammaproteobacteria bacterium]|nr:MAG: hypothetical protein EPO11_04055 [Gammaproteobacteria bacterium]